jgi:RHS repeat-associated protein
MRANVVRAATKSSICSEAAPPRRSRLSTAQPSVFGSGARTSYIGREHDKETDLGFYGVRLYEPEYGRFLSTDVLWGLYRSVQPYQYSLNQPVSQIDDGGKWVEAKTPQAQEAVRNSVPERFRSAVVFNDDGILQVDPLKQAAEGQDVNSNVAVLSRLAENESTIEVKVDTEVEYITKDGVKDNRSFNDVESSTNGRFAWLGQTLVPRSDGESSGAKGNGFFSPNGNIQVVLNANPPKTSKTVGMTTAHELYAHARFILLCRYGLAKRAAHGDPSVEKAVIRAEAEAKK